MSEAPRTTRPRRVRLRFWLVPVVALTALVVLILGARYEERSSFVNRASTGLCGLLIRGWNPPSPYGAITACRTLDRHIPLFGKVDGNLYLLLQTASGSAAIRIDYSAMELGSHYRAEAFELDAAHTPGLSQAEKQRLRHDVDARGGLRPTPWIIHVGDG
jgi:hypothetical protein